MQGGDERKSDPTQQATFVAELASPAAVTAALPAVIGHGPARAPSLQLPPERLCPACGLHTEARRCGMDGIPTIDTAGLSVDPTSLRAGDELTERYTIREQIGRGAFGAVYLCEHSTTRQPIAVKVLSVPREELDADHIRRFYQEAAVSAQLTHPNAIRVFDFGQSVQGPLFLAMEYLGGQTLASALQALHAAGQRMAAAEVAWLGIEILRALTEAHDHGLVHRDLKPANIMLVSGHGDRPTVKVLDFGIARTLGSSLTGEGKALGTPTYMSPEQCVGAPLDGRSDLYALGVVLYFALAGQPPFAERDPLAVMYKHRHELPVPPSLPPETAVPPGLVGVVMRALAKDPANRFKDARAMREALEGVAGGAWAQTPMRAFDVDATVAAAPALAVGDGVAARRPAWGGLAAGAVAFVAMVAAAWWATRADRAAIAVVGAAPPPAALPLAAPPQPTEATSPAAVAAVDAAAPVAAPPPAVDAAAVTDVAPPPPAVAAPAAAAPSPRRKAAGKPATPAAPAPAAAPIVRPAVTL